AIYAYDRTTSSYQIVDPSEPLEGGQGYWAFLDAAAAVTLPDGANTPLSVSTGAGTWLAIGNPSGAEAALVTGADAVYVFAAFGGQYVATMMLTPGQGAWALSLHGGTIPIAPGQTAPAPTPSPTPAVQQAPAQAPYTAPPVNTAPNPSTPQYRPP